MDAPAGVTQEEGNSGVFHLPSAALALIFMASRIQPSLPLVDRKSNLHSVYLRINVLHLMGVTFLFFILFLVRKNPTSWDCTDVRTRVPRLGGFEITN